MLRGSYQNAPRAGIGIQEDDLHPYTGLRVWPYRQRLVQAPTCVVAGFPLTENGEWTPITLNPEFRTRYAVAASRRIIAGVPLPYPVTPCISFINTNATPEYGQLVRFRLRGYDMFGNGITEVTPPLLIPTNGLGSSQGQVTYIWCSKVFSEIYSAEYRYTPGAGSAGFDHVSIGTMLIYDQDDALASDGEQIHIQPSGSEFTSANTLSLRNMGIGLPCLMTPASNYFTGAGFLDQDDRGFQDILSVNLFNATTAQDVLVPRGRSSTPAAGGALQGGWILGDRALNPLGVWQGGYGNKLRIFTDTTNWPGSLDLQPLQGVEPVSTPDVLTIDAFAVAGQFILDLNAGTQVPAKYVSNAGAGRPINIMVTGTSTAIDGQWVAAVVTADSIASLDYPGTAAATTTGTVVLLSQAARLLTALGPTDVMDLEVWLRSTYGARKARSGRPHAGEIPLHG